MALSSAQTQNEILQLQVPESAASASFTTSPLHLKTPITWTDEMNVMLCREVEYVNPFQHKERTKERGKAWEEVAANLRKHGHDVTKRSVRDKYKAVKDITKQNSKEKKDSGIAPELTDVKLELMVEDLVEVENERKLETREQQNEEEKKKLDGVEMRKRALESFTETSKRLKLEKDKLRKGRNTGSDASEFLLRKLEMDREMKERDFELRMEEVKRRRQDEEREEERRRQDEERRREKEEREEERRRQDEERRREKEEREEERRRKDEEQRERRMELLQQQLLQQNQLIMLMLKNHQKD